MKKIWVIAGMAMLTACGCSDEKPTVEEKPAAPLAKSKNSDSFNASFGHLLNNYFALKDNFIAENEAKINELTTQLIKDADSVKFNELKADTAIIQTAKSSAETMVINLKNLLNEKTLLGKRKAFNAVSGDVYALIQTVQYDRATIYHQHCPMAFEEGDANAFWLSKESDIKNPYLPKKMLECGDVVDSLKFSN